MDSSPAIGADGTVYVGSNDSKLYAINGKTGAKLWEFETRSLVKSSPAIGADGTVYVGSNDYKLYAINGKSGVKLWEFETGGWVRSSPAIGSDGTVYVGSPDNKLYAINGKTGVKLWEFETGRGVSSSPAIGSDGTVYVGSDDKKLYAINGKTGVKLWEFETGERVASSPAIGPDGTVYVGSHDKKLYAINGKKLVKIPLMAEKPKQNTIKPLWVFELEEGEVPAKERRWDEATTPSIDKDGTVYVGIGWSVYALDGIEGKKKWVYRNQGPVLDAPMIDDEKIYISPSDYRVHVVDKRSKSERWNFKLDQIKNAANWSRFGGHWGWSSLALGADGTLYVSAGRSGSVGKLNVVPPQILNIGRFYALGENFIFENGKRVLNPVEKWNLKGGFVSSSPAIGPKGNVFVGAGNDNELISFDGAGKVRWIFRSKRIDGAWRMTAPSIGLGGMVYYGTREGTLYGIDMATGKTRMRFQSKGMIEGTPIIGADGTVYFKSSKIGGNNKLHAVNGKTGLAKWEFELNKNMTDPAVDANGVVYFGTRSRALKNNNLYAVDGKTGAKKWEFETGGSVSAPIIGENGILYVGVSGRKVYAFKTGSKGYADSPWPMSGQNPQNTRRLPGLQ